MEVVDFDVSLFTVGRTSSVRRLLTEELEELEDFDQKLKGNFEYKTRSINADNERNAARVHVLVSSIL